MNFQQFSATAFLAMLGLGGQCQCADAGWFGPNNYNECVLNKFNGKALDTREIFDIEQACRGLFPPKQKPTRLNSSFIKYGFCNEGDVSNSISICVTDSPSGYRIVGVNGSFGDKSTCDAFEHPAAADNLSAYLDERYGLEADTRFLHLYANTTNSSDTFQFNIQRGRFYCYDFVFYGFID